jgi:hypothetical protein
MAQNTAPTARKPGPFTAPLFDQARASAILAEIEQAKQAERMRLADLSRALGITPKSQNHLIATGLLDAERLGGRGNPYAISTDEARTLLLAVVLAVAAGVAISIMLRGVKDAGLVGPAAAAALRSAVPT